MNIKTTLIACLSILLSISGYASNNQQYTIGQSNDSVTIVIETLESGIERYGLMSKDGKTIMPMQYDRIYIQQGYVYAELGDKSTIANFAGTALFPLDKYQYINYEQRDAACTIELDGKQGLMAIGGKILIPPKYRSVYYENAIARIGTDKHKWGMYSMKTKKLLEPKYDGFTRFVNGVAMIGYYNSVGNKHGLIDKDGRELVEPIYETMFFDKTQQYADVSLNGKCGIIGAQGEILIPVIYDRMKYYSTSQNVDGIAVMQLGDKYGAYSFHQKKELLPVVCDNIFNFGSVPGLRYVLNGKNGFVDKDGNTILEPKYSSISAVMRNGYLRVTLDGKQGIANMKGEFVIPCQYDEISDTTDEHIIAKKDGKMGIIDYENKIIIPFE